MSGWGPGGDFPQTIILPDNIDGRKHMGGRGVRNLLLLTILNFIFSPTPPLSFLKFSFSRLLIIETRQNIHFQQILVHGVCYLRLNYCSGSSWSTSSPKSSISASIRDKLKSPNSTSRALSATCVTTVSNEVDSPLAVRRWTCSWTWTVCKSPITPCRWPRTAEIWLVFIISVDNSSSLSWLIVLTPWFIHSSSTFGKRNLPLAIRRSRSGIRIRCVGKTMTTEGITQGAQKDFLMWKTMKKMLIKWQIPLQFSMLWNLWKIQSFLVIFLFWPFINSGNFKFLCSFQSLENCKGICHFISIFFIIFYIRKFFCAPCEMDDWSLCGSDG